MVTSFIIVYLTYPTIANLSFSLFDCVHLDDGYSYLRRDLQIKCWTGTHSSVAFLIALPIIIVWVVLFPLVVLFKLC